MARVKVWLDGEILTASDLNAEFDNALASSLTPDTLDDVSGNLVEMQAVADPYPAGAASLATTMRGEIQRLRYLLKQITGKSEWYIDPDTTLTAIAADYVHAPSVTTGDILIRGTSEWERFSFTGTVLPFTKSTAPDGWIICNGSAYSRTTYANLFAVIGTTFGSGDGSTTFNVPDLRDRVAVGSGSTYALADTGGEATHTLTVAEMPSHRHSELGWAAIPGYASSGSGNYSGTYTGYAGGSQAHNNMQPYVALNYIIKY